MYNFSFLLEDSNLDNLHFYGYDFGYCDLLPVIEMKSRVECPLNVGKWMFYALKEKVCVLTREEASDTRILFEYIFFMYV